ncbi:hypothetical protein FIU89_01550 [Roseovarius sp. THAF27]|uniref:YihY/virulence factor BrkB family protein n=1 Tax=Roseovarius sp. THAF27 TaxID=2587850 RepID=UPI0012686455|nr:YihY/virulence factor BrkB family protein [Roseovarius sp. THAF27]QFT79278.1 hypothetical protein FIU89_01550 [Roseovarius sp. THAF27]
MPDKGRGHTADHPHHISRHGWWDVVLRLKDGIASDHMSVVSAGVAFFGLLAIFPAVVALISIAGFLLNPQDVANNLEQIIAILPENAAAIIQDQIMKVTGGDEAATGLAALLGLLLALYGATKGMMTLMEGMNIAYGEKEKRGFVRLYATGLALTLFIIVGVLSALGLMIVLPAVIGYLGLSETLETTILWLQWPVLGCLAVLGLGVLYRFGPSRRNARWRWITPGAVVAMILWLAGTVAFSVYTQNFASYNETYGTLGGAIILLTWLWLSSFIVLAGAKLNAELEHQTRRDTTTGPSRPEGQRGAVKSDTFPDAGTQATPGAAPGKD